MVYILLGQGFEEIEALAVCDVLRRGGVETMLAGLMPGTVTGGHGIRVTPDCTVRDINPEKTEMLVVPGGLGGVVSIENDPAALDAVRAAWEQGKEIAAICAGPRVLAGLGILNGRKAVCYPGMEAEMTGGIMQPDGATARDGRLTTGRGPGAAIDFGLHLLTVLRGEAAAETVRAAMCYDR